MRAQLLYVVNSNNSKVKHFMDLFRKFEIAKSSATNHLLDKFDKDYINIVLYMKNKV